jgi:hypothetical protein
MSQPDYKNSFVNLTPKQDYYAGVIMAAQCPMFASDEVRVYIKERETQTGKKIK